MTQAWRLEYTKYNNKFVEMYFTWAAAKLRADKLKITVYHIYPVKLFV